MEINLSQSKVAIIDDSDAWIAQWKWSYDPGNGGRAIRSDYSTGKHLRILMHRVIMNAPPEMEVDHIDHDGLNNRRSNLRLTTRSQNQMNRKKRDGTSSKFKGVSWISRDKLWQVHIQINGKQRRIGSFKNEKDAAVAYNQAARELFGEFALFNNVEE